VSKVSDSFEHFFQIVKRLRAPDGCPWDLEQTPISLRSSLIEETYECIEAIDEGDPAHIREELGDVFLLACMISYMHEQGGLFSVSDVLDELCDKLVRRHPHVFGDVKAENSAEVLKNWTQIKVEQEGRSRKDSALDEVSRSLPPLERAFKLQKKAAKQGFDWPDAAGVFAKIEEELNEVRAAAASGGDAGRRALEAELGDMLFSAVNLCRFFKIDPSAAMHGANTKFTRRFKYVEKRMKETGQVMEASSLKAMDEFWANAKKEEVAQPSSSATLS
jgi:tetrapyrrole methylase family protein/MazG family protein